MAKVGMGDALRTVTRQHLDSRTLIRSVSQATFEVEGAAAFEKAVREAAKWMRNRNGSIPNVALTGASFEIGGGGDQPAQAVNLSFDGGRVWAASLDFADTSLIGRTWVTELTVAERASKTHFAARLVNVTRGDDAPFAPSLPGVIRQIVERTRAYADGVELGELPSEVDSADDVDGLIALLDDPARSLPVVVVADGLEWQPVADATELAKRLVAAAHVFSLSQAGANELRDRLGRSLSVFGGGARIYKVGFNSEYSHPYDYKLWVAQRHFVDKSQQIVSAVLLMSVSKPVGGDYPRFSAIRQAAARVAKEERVLAGDSDLRELYEEENERLEGELREIREEFDQWMVEVDLERQELERALAETKADAARYRAQAESLRAAISSGEKIEKLPLTDLKGFSDWAAQNLSSNVWIAPKALKAMEKNWQFDNPKLLGDVLSMLDDTYVPMRINPSDEGRSAFVKRLEELGCKDRPCFADQNEIKNHPEYSVSYQGERVWCNDHIKYGGGTDPRRMFRIYYSYSESNQTIFIGHMPTHLDNNLTN